ncbi:tannase/feruloyl esterase family alpha/beta hydrolase [Caulobacter sp. LARHSG274]
MDKGPQNSRPARALPWRPGAAIVAGVAVATASVLAFSASSQTPQPDAQAVALQSVCQPQSAQAIASGIEGGVTVQQLTIDPKHSGGVRFVPAKGNLPAYCQISGAFVTNAKTGKTAQFLATLPANWNGKYLQIGCSGHCGNFAVSNAAGSVITISTQGWPGQIIAKGYASFATDEGHIGMDGGAWAVKGPGQVDEDAITDYLYRAQKVLAHMGKAFTTAFYAKANGAPREIQRAYFSGCSGGGRDAFVAAAHFPEEFDGIIAGSAYTLAPTAMHVGGTLLASLRSPDAAIPAELLSKVDPIVKDRCDKLDGVQDGLIQNPAACDFRPERDLPRCVDDKPGAQCFTKAQIETLSVGLSAVTDEKGRVVQPGLSVSELTPSVASTGAPKDPMAADPWPDTGAEISMWSLSNAVLKVFVHKNDPAFSTRQLFSYKRGGPGQVAAFHGVVPGAEADRAMTTLAAGMGQAPDSADKLIKLDRKFLIWHNLSDEKLTFYASANYYGRQAKRHGGYAKLQDNIRLFAIPGSGHCSMSGVGPNNFDALTAMEDWVEKGQAPDALPAKLYSMRSPIVDPNKTPLRTMPLCKFPEMARYSGKGDVKDGGNWTCPAGDRSMLKVAYSGRQAGATY